MQVCVPRVRRRRKTSTSTCLDFLPLGDLLDVLSTVNNDDWSTGSVLTEPWHDDRSLSSSIFDNQSIISQDGRVEKQRVEVRKLKPTQKPLKHLSGDIDPSGCVQLVYLNSEWQLELRCYPPLLPTSQKEKVSFELETLSVKEGIKRLDNNALFDENVKQSPGVTTVTAIGKGRIGPFPFTSLDKGGMKLFRFKATVKGVEMFSYPLLVVGGTHLTDYDETTWTQERKKSIRELIIQLQRDLPDWLPAVPARKGIGTTFFLIFKTQLSSNSQQHPYPWMRHVLKRCCCNQ